MPIEQKGNAARTQTNAPKSKNKKKTDLATGPSTSSVIDFFREQQSSQNLHNMSFSSTSSFDSANNGTMVELPQMISFLEVRRKALEERRSDISKIKDEQVKNILLAMVDDMKNVVEDGDKILQCHNNLVNKQNEDSDIIQSNSDSINNLTKGIGNLTDGINVVRNRVESLEVSKNCSFDSQFINIVFVDANEASCVENGTTGPKQKFVEILSELKIVPPKDIIDAHLMTVRRFDKGRRKQIKMLRTRFADSLTAGRIFSLIIQHNKNLSDTGGKNAIKFYAEMPASKNVWNLKRICYELKSEGTFVNVRGSERGILVSYKLNNQEDDKEITKTANVTSVKEINDLRILLNVKDAYMSVADKYNEDFWNKKKKNEMPAKRSRVSDVNDDSTSPKRHLTDAKSN